jgi:hypothetical protein
MNIGWENDQRILERVLAAMEDLWYHDIHGMDSVVLPQLCHVVCCVHMHLAIPDVSAVIQHFQTKRVHPHTINDRDFIVFPFVDYTPPAMLCDILV